LEKKRPAEIGKSEISLACFIDKLESGKKDLPKSEKVDKIVPKPPLKTPYIHGA